MARPPSTATLAELESLHAAQSGSSASTTREHARRLAAKLGVPEPAWCARRPHFRPPPKFKASSSEPDPSWGRELQSLGLETAARGVASQIPEALRVWRTGNGNRVVQISLHGITLHEIGERSRTFADIAAAVSAVA